MAGTPSTQIVGGIEIPADQQTPLVESLLRVIDRPEATSEESRARQPRVDTPWCVVLHAIAWLMLAAQSPLDVQVPDEHQQVQVPALQPPPEGFDERDEHAVLPIVPISPPQPQTGRDGVSSFVAGLKGNDAVLEVVLGQGRILSTRSDISAQGARP